MKKIGDELEGFFETFGIKDEKNYLGFMGAWNTLIGLDLCSHCRPTDIRGSVLLIAVDHPGWMTRIRFEEKKMLKKIRQAFPQLGINALGFILVEKLPKPVPLATSQKEIPSVDDSLGTSSGQVVDSILTVDEDSDVTEKPIAGLDSEFQLAMKKLKTAMARKSRNDI